MRGVCMRVTPETARHWFAFVHLGRRFDFGNLLWQETYAYAKTMLDVATAGADGRGRALIVGGGISNFTDVAATFKGIIQVCVSKGAGMSQSLRVRHPLPSCEGGRHLMAQVFRPNSHCQTMLKLIHACTCACCKAQPDYLARRCLACVCSTVRFAVTAESQSPTQVPGHSTAS